MTTQAGDKNPLWLADMVKLLERLNKAMIALWGPLPLADDLSKVPELTAVARQIREQQMAVIPLLREAHTILQDKMDATAREHYTEPTSGSTATKPKKS